ncbi:hypothetical protein [Limnoglobus roseus]|nr:hypothetical protein [Limnoglobus roseus]
MTGRFCGGARLVERQPASWLGRLTGNQFAELAAMFQWVPISRDV